MRNSRAFLVVILAILVMATWQSHALQSPVRTLPPGNSALQSPVRILPLGDSITQGGRADRPEYTYRLPLQQLLVEAQVKFDFVGSLHTGLHPEATWPEVAPGVAFDPDHEGHYGWKTSAVRDKLDEWLPRYPAPDLALIHLGTNDQDAAKNATDEAAANALFTQAIVQPLEDIIGKLRSRNPQMVILVGHLNFNDGPATQIRPLVEAMATRLSTPASPVLTVHHYRGFIAQPGIGGDTFDWAHPNPQGQKKMAIAWFTAMQPYLLPFRSQGSTKPTQSFPQDSRKLRGLPIGAIAP